MSVMGEIGVDNEDCDLVGAFCSVGSKREIHVSEGGIIDRLQVRIRDSSNLAIIRWSGDENTWIDTGNRAGNLYIGNAKVRKLMMDTRNWVITAVSENEGQFYISLDDVNNSFIPSKDSGFFRFTGLNFSFS